MTAYGQNLMAADTLMTSAPIPAKSKVQVGPDRYWVRSRTRIPLSMAVQRRRTGAPTPGRAGSQLIVMLRRWPLPAWLLGPEAMLHSKV